MQALSNELNQTVVDFCSRLSLGEITIEAVDTTARRIVLALEYPLDVSEPPIGTLTVHIADPSNERHYVAELDHIRKRKWGVLYVVSKPAKPRLPEGRFDDHATIALYYGKTELFRKGLNELLIKPEDSEDLKTT